MRALQSILRFYFTSLLKNFKERKVLVALRVINRILLLPYGVINFYYTSPHHLIDD